jgi:hypothetical protein
MDDAICMKVLSTGAKTPGRSISSKDGTMETWDAFKRGIAEKRAIREFIKSLNANILI